ncbi:hypothetical protein SAVIM40S_00176 [Streptomyces avidinii]|uniref:Uncharacterized protein n=1 Tax=Streptomyces avidinii TaxID=1895 RepID=A0ABS4L3W7_STRAV|nr:hypothetical protein [Streptomyces avidinii]
MSSDTTATATATAVAAPPARAGRSPATPEGQDRSGPRRRSGGPAKERNRLDPSGEPQPHPADDALARLYRLAVHG